MSKQTINIFLLLALLGNTSFLAYTEDNQQTQEKHLTEEDLVHPRVKQVIGFLEKLSHYLRYCNTPIAIIRDCKNLLPMKHSPNNAPKEIQEAFFEVCKKANVNPPTLKHVSYDEGAPNAIFMINDAIIINDKFVETFKENTGIAKGLFAHELGHKVNKDPLLKVFLLILLPTILNKNIHKIEKKLITLFRKLYPKKTITPKSSKIKANLKYIGKYLLKSHFRNFIVINCSMKLINLVFSLCETRADKFATNLGYGNELIESFELIAKYLKNIEFEQNIKFIPNQVDGSDFKSRIHGAHPTLKVRIAAIRKWIVK